jgi:hypothetical protein
MAGQSQGIRSELTQARTSHVTEPAPPIPRRSRFVQLGRSARKGSARRLPLRQRRWRRDYRGRQRHFRRPRHGFRQSALYLTIWTPRDRNSHRHATRNRVSPEQHEYRWSIRQRLVPHHLLTRPLVPARNFRVLHRFGRPTARRVPRGAAYRKTRGGCQPSNCANAGRHRSYLSGTRGTARRAQTVCPP